MGPYIILLKFAQNISQKKKKSTNKKKNNNMCLRTLEDNDIQTLVYEFSEINELIRSSFISLQIHSASNIYHNAPIYTLRKKGSLAVPQVEPKWFSKWF